MAGMTAAAGGSSSTAAVAVTAAVAAAMVAGMVVGVLAPAAGAVAAPLIVVAGSALVGARRRWGLHRRSERRATALAEHGLEPAGTDDECELSTFAALQRAEEHLELAGLLLDATAPADMVAAHGRLAHRVDTFVFSGLGLGDLAAAWAIEQECEVLADDALSDRRRPAA